MYPMATGEAPHSCVRLPSLLLGSAALRYCTPTMPSPSSTRAPRAQDPPDSALLDLHVPQDARRMPRHRLWAHAIREGFVALLPLTLLGAMANVLAYLPIRGYNEWMSQLFGAQ